MKRVLKKYFIPHRENNFHPHILHTKRAIMYSLVFLFMKIILVAFVLLLPTGVFVLPDVLAEEQKQIVALTNVARREKNLPALVVSSKLDLSSQYKAEDMAQKNYFAHVREEKSLASWLKDVNYKYQVAGENLAVGFSSAEEIVKAWKNSPTHYANLIDPEFKDLGVGLSGGIYNGRATIFVAQHLGAQVVVAQVEKQSTKKVVAKKSSSVEIKTEIPSPSVVEVAKASSSVLAGKIDTAQEAEPPVMSTNQQTPIDRYMQAKRVLLPITNIFAVSQNIYLSAIFFFSFILLLNIVIVVAAGKKRHHVVAQTSGLIALLLIFWKF